METLHRRYLALLVVIAAISRVSSAQNVPPSPDHCWHFLAEHKIEDEAKALRPSRLAIDEIGDRSVLVNGVSEKWTLVTRCLAMVAHKHDCGQVSRAVFSTDLE
jgi:hypothetical protein